VAHSNGVSWRGRAVLVRAGLAGACGGLGLALADFAASALWLPEPRDRVALALRLTGLLASLGALAAMGVVLLDRAARPSLARLHRSLGRSLRSVAPLPLLALLAPFTVALSVSVFSGGSISRVPLRPLFVGLVAVLLLGLLYFGMRATRAIARRAHRRSLALRALVAVGFALVAGIGAEASQELYPRHYDVLHGTLTLASWWAASLAGWLVLSPRPSSIVQRVRPRILAVAACVALAGTLASLPGDHDGRAALLSPRVSNARSVMLAAGPVLFAWQRARSSEQAVARAREARARRRARVEAPLASALPSWEGAHLVLVTIDALRADHLGAYGYRRLLSPSLDALASDAVLFDRAWTSTPRSSYALCSLMTGVALHARAGEGPAPRRTTLAEHLGERGIHTAGFYPEGIFFHEGERLDAYREAELGFSRRDAENHDAESLTDAVLAELRDLEQRGEPQSLLWVHYFDVHEPYRERSLGDAPVDRYDGEIRNVDRAFARLREGLASLSREVVLVVTADHGEEHGDHGGVFHGGSLYEEQLRVPLLIAAPGLDARRVSEPVSLLDLAPTVAAMLGVPPLEGVDGIDLRPALIAGGLDRGPIRATEDGMEALLAWPLKLIEDRAEGTVMLFDLDADPAERRSLASARPESVLELTAELEAY
jgi:hypothetical protein